jgi:phage anti-repressor protein
MLHKDFSAMNMHSKNIALPSTVQSLVSGKIVETKSMMALHAFLGVKTRFRAWVKRKSQGWTEGVDFIIAPTIGHNKQGPTPESDRFCSIRMAGHIGLQENNEQGKKLRDHCLEIVGKWNAGESKALDVTDPKMLRDELRRQLDTVDRLEIEITAKDTQIAKAKPHTDALRALCKSDKQSARIEDVAKGVGTGDGYPPQWFRKYFVGKHLKWIFQREGWKHWRVSEIGANRNGKPYVEEKKSLHHNPEDGAILHETPVVYITGFGQAVIANMEARGEIKALYEGHEAAKAESKKKSNKGPELDMFDA